MVNKVAVLLVGGIVVVGVVVIGGVAAFVLGSGGPAGDATPTAVDETPLPSPTANGPGTATDGPAATPSTTATATVTGTPTATPTATPRPTVLPSEFDDDEIERHIAELINERREADGLDPLRLDGSTSNSVTEMARDHSAAMAEEGEAVHVIDGNTSTDRYHQYELYTTCRWRQPGGESFASSDHNGITGSENGFEAVARTIAGREYEDDGDTFFHRDEEAVAEHIVDEWWNSTLPPYADRLTLPNARHLGVGVEITQYGEVYATANIC